LEGVNGYVIFGKAHRTGRRGASCEVITTTIGQRASLLQCLDRAIEIALGLVKIGGKIEEGVIGF